MSEIENESSDQPSSFTRTALQILKKHADKDLIGFLSVNNQKKEYIKDSLIGLITSQQLESISFLTTAEIAVAKSKHN